ncbi:CRISPR-associated endonuclease Cas9 [invertebrate metagenome]|uniref:CRISPR-associated endonuclease Cas9 n=1 Tax=invertebrate metagenome TaxID=1711999 RepID=A0A2H9TAR0_9ZZZZ
MARAQLQRLLWQQGGECFYCRKRLSLKDASIDHVIPRSLGGQDKLDNKVICCRTINQLFANISPKTKISYLLNWKNKEMPCPAQLEDLKEHNKDNDDLKEAPEPLPKMILQEPVSS